MQCPRCGAPLGPLMRFCPQCATPLAMSGTTAPTSMASLQDYLPRARGTWYGQEDYTVAAWASLFLYGALYPIGVAANWVYLRRCRRAYRETGMYPRGYRMLNFYPWVFVVLPLVLFFAGIVYFSASHS